MQIKQAMQEMDIGKSSNLQIKGPAYKGVTDKQFWNKAANYFNTAEGQK